jgi:hypothetical protein
MRAWTLATLLLTPEPKPKGESKEGAKGESEDSPVDSEVANAANKGASAVSWQGGAIENESEGKGEGSTDSNESEDERESEEIAKKYRGSRPKIEYYEPPKPEPPKPGQTKTVQPKMRMRGKKRE